MYPIWILPALLLLLALVAFGNGDTALDVPVLHPCQDIKRGDSSWLIASSTPSGLCNQLTAVYSYVPTALAYNASLILGPLFSRTSFEISARAYYKRDKKPLPFDEFFDVNHFQQFWSTEGLKIVLLDQVSGCLPKANSKRMIVLRRPRWSVFTDHLLRTEFLGFNNISWPLQTGSILSIKSSMGMMALYDFHHLNPAISGSTLTINDLRNRNHNLLMKIHRSIQPNPKLRPLINTVIAALPPQYIAAHLRIEGDVIEYQPETNITSADFSAIIHSITALTPLDLTTIASHNIESIVTVADRIIGLFHPIASSDPTFYLLLPQVISSVLKSQCVASASNTGNSSIQVPAMFIASGAFASSKRSFLRRRAIAVRTILHHLGFHHITSRTAIFESIYTAMVHSRRSRQLASAKFWRDPKSRHHPIESIASNPNRHLDPEVAAYIDLEVARRAACFIPAHKSSSFSYMAMRFQELDKGEVEISNIPPPFSEYRQWGF